MTTKDAGLTITLEAKTVMEQATKGLMGPKSGLRMATNQELARQLATKALVKLIQATGLTTTE